MNFYNILNVRLRVLPGEITFVQINTHYVGGKDNIATPLVVLLSAFACHCAKSQGSNLFCATHSDFFFFFF